MFHYLIWEKMCDMYGCANVTRSRLAGGHMISAIICPGEAVSVAVGEAGAMPIGKSGALARSPLTEVWQVEAVLRGVDLSSRWRLAREDMAIRSVAKVDEGVEDGAA